MAPLKIVVVGAGIAGPAAAIGLARNGHHVTIYERSTSGTEVGYAFRITPNSDRCLKYWGIDTVAGGAVAANSGRIFNAQGDLITQIDENTDAENTKKATSVFAYRPQLVKQLVDTAVDSGAELKTGIKVRSVDVDKTTITLDGGETVSADVILAADGIHSLIRPNIIDSTKHYPTASSGHNAFRFMVPKSVAQADPLLSSVINESSRMFSWSSGESRIIVYPVDHDKLLNVTLSHPAHLSDKEAEKDQDAFTAISYNQKASFETVRDVHKDWDPRAIRLLELADPNGFRIWKLLDMDEIPHCSRNHTVLLGDACHPVLPFGFSGASMGIEDAATISEFLARDVTPEELPGLFQLYEEVRKPRVARVRDQARKTAHGDLPREDMQDYMLFLLSHDAVRTARERLAEYKRRQL